MAVPAPPQPTDGDRAALKMFERLEGLIDDATLDEIVRGMPPSALKQWLPGLMKWHISELRTVLDELGPAAAATSVAEAIALAGLFVVQHALFPTTVANDSERVRVEEHCIAILSNGRWRFWPARTEWGHVCKPSADTREIVRSLRSAASSTPAGGGPTVIEGPADQDVVHVLVSGLIARDAASSRLADRWNPLFRPVLRVPPVRSRLVVQLRAFADSLRGHALESESRVVVAGVERAAGFDDPTFAAAFAKLSACSLLDGATKIGHGAGHRNESLNLDDMTDYAATHATELIPTPAVLIRGGAGEQPFALGPQAPLGIFAAGFDVERSEVLFLGQRVAVDRDLDAPSAPGLCKIKRFGWRAGGQGAECELPWILGRVAAQPSLFLQVLYDAAWSASDFAAVPGQVKETLRELHAYFSSAEAAGRTIDAFDRGMMVALLNKFDIVAATCRAAGEESVAVVADKVGACARVLLQRMELKHGVVEYVVRPGIPVRDVPPPYVASVRAAERRYADLGPETVVELVRRVLLDGAGGVVQQGILVRNPSMTTYGG